MEDNSEEGPVGSLPERSIFDLDEYLKMWNVASSEPGYQILSLLHEKGELSTRDLSDRLGRSGNELHYHLRKLRHSALIRSQRGPPSGTEEPYSSHSLTDIGEIVLTTGPKPGIEQLAKEERTAENPH